jgi:MFS family permease
MLVNSATSALPAQTRCGWYQMPTPGDLWLTDKDATWSITSQSEAEGPDAVDAEKALRATGAGYAAASGRVGSILGPALGGAMLSFGWSARDIILTTILSAILAMPTVTVLGLVEHNRRLALNAV